MSVELRLTNGAELFDNILISFVIWYELPPTISCRRTITTQQNYDSPLLICSKPWFWEMFF